MSTASPTVAPGPPRAAAALLEAGEALVADLAAELRAAVPPGTAVLDAHAHVGLDADGMVGDADELLAMLDEHGVARAFVFSLNEPDRDPDFRAPNDRTLAAAERSGGRLVAFARLALDGDPVAEAERCLARAARGIKLHPRAAVRAGRRPSGRGLRGGGRAAGPGARARRPKDRRRLRGRPRAAPAACGRAGR